MGIWTRLFGGGNPHPPMPGRDFARFPTQEEHDAAEAEAAAGVCGNCTRYRPMLANVEGSQLVCTLNPPTLEPSSWKETSPTVFEIVDFRVVGLPVNVMMTCSHHKRRKPGNGV